MSVGMCTYHCLEQPMCKVCPYMRVFWLPPTHTASQRRAGMFGWAWKGNELIRVCAHLFIDVSCDYFIGKENKVAENKKGNIWNTSPCCTLAECVTYRHRIILDENKLLVVACLHRGQTGASNVAAAVVVSQELDVPYKLLFFEAPPSKRLSCWNRSCLPEESVYISLRHRGSFG